MQNFLKRHYLNNEKLKQRTLIEFSNWVSTGRMIAFTGAMATENMGYGSWSDLSDSYLFLSKILIEQAPDFAKKDQIKSAIFAIESAMKADRNYDKRIGFSLAREALRQADEAVFRHRRLSLEEFRKGFGARSPESLVRLRQFLAEACKSFVEAGFSLESILGCCVATLFHFRFNETSHPVTAQQLLRQLGIKRFATLSYDLELEEALMTERGALEKFDAKNPYDVLIKALHDGDIRCDAAIPSRWQVLLHNGRHVESNILLRERPDLLVEFATGSTRLTQHIMHMHGRACTPDSMIVGLRDYDSLYRKTDISTLPFEHARQLLFTGNPILFLGLGMSETEVNATLQTYVSNNPYRYLTPNFLLWNSHGFPQEPTKRAKMMFAKRVAWLQSLGVMVIFDEDLDDADLGKRVADARNRNSIAKLVHTVVGLDPNKTANIPTSQQLKTDARKAEVNLLPATVEALAKRVAHIWTTSATHMRGTDQKPIWRSMRPRFERADTSAREDRTYRLWSRVDKPVSLSELPACFDDLFSPAFPVVRVIVGEPGSGKGALARQIVDSGGQDAANRQYLLINAGFSFDTDSLLNALKHFMIKVSHPGSYAPGSDDTVRDLLSNQSREQFFCDPTSFKKPAHNADRSGLIVVNGMERFFSIDGRPLSGELDHILRSIASLEAETSNYSFVFLGTGRIKRYFETILGERYQAAALERNVLQSTAQVAPSCGTRVKSKYFRAIEDAFWGTGADAAAERRRALPYSDITIIDNNAEADIDSLRRAFFRAYLDPAVLGAGGIAKPELALDLLRTFAFVGAPVEAIVLAHVPSIRRRMNAGVSYSELLTEICRCLEELKDRYLIVPVKTHEAYGKSEAHWKRYGLHKTLLKELRARHGIPLSPAKRSTAFNMSLYASQPIDGDSPEPQVHEELGGLVDHLIGAYKDYRTQREDIFADQPDLVRQALKKSNKDLPSPVNLAEDAYLLHPETSAALRAALAVIRGYYSTSSLLRIDRNVRGDNYDGRLSGNYDGR